MKNLDTYKLLKKKVLFRADLNVPVSIGKIDNYVSVVIVSLATKSSGKNRSIAIP